MTTQTCTFGTVKQFAGSGGAAPNITTGNVGYVEDNNGSEPNSATCTAWSAITASLFNGTSGTGANTGNINGVSSSILLLTNPTWSGGGIPGGVTITDISISIGRVQQSASSGGSRNIYDWLLYLINYNGTDLSSGALSSTNLAIGPPNYSLGAAAQWPYTSTAPSSTGTFTVLSYDAGTPSGATVSVLNSSTFGVVFSCTGPSAASHGYVNEVEVTVTYTGGGSPPGAPTGLSLTYVSPTSLQANWTNPSGTLTDNKIQISTDDTIWTTIDIGSVVTSYTFTGLTPNTLYYVQVAAVNSSGLGSYSYYAWWPTQATVSLETTLTLVGDLTNTGWTIVGSEPTCAATLNSTNDANYLIPPANTGQYLNMTLTGVPSNLITVTSAVVNARMKTTSGSDTNSITAAVGSLQLQITNALTTSIANYASANLPLASQQGYAQWNAFTLEAFPFDVNQDNLTYRMSVTITYLAPAPVWPPVGFNNSIMNSCSMASRW